MDVASAVDSEGWAVTQPVLPQLVLDRLIEELAPIAAERSRRGGIRNLLEQSGAVRRLAASREVREVAETVLGPQCFAVRAILFDKTPAANWKVLWHQDLTIAVRRRVTMAGFDVWSEKAGIPHVHAPAEILERMLAVRIHLDDCGPDNGPVRVLPGSHRVGRLSPDAIDAWKASGAAVDCIVERGGILAFRPLVLHASAPARSPAHRRVLHFEFAAETPPEPLEWYSQVA